MMILYLGAVKSRTWNSSFVKQRCYIIVHSFTVHIYEIVSPFGNHKMKSWNYLCVFQCFFLSFNICYCIYKPKISKLIPFVYHKSMLPFMEVYIFYICICTTCSQRTVFILNSHCQSIIVKKMWPIQFFLSASEHHTSNFFLYI